MSVGRTADSRDQLNSSSSSTSRYDVDYHASMEVIGELIACEQHAVGLMQYRISTSSDEDINDMLSSLGNDIIGKLVRWVKHLPFFHDVAYDVHLRMLSARWHHIVLFTLSINQAWHYVNESNCSADISMATMMETNLYRVHAWLTTKLERQVDVESVYSEMGSIMEQVTRMVHTFTVLKLTWEEYVCLKVVMLSMNESK